MTSSLLKNPENLASLARVLPTRQRINPKKMPFTFECGHTISEGDIPEDKKCPFCGKENPIFNHMLNYIAQNDKIPPLYCSTHPQKKITKFDLESQMVGCPDCTDLTNAPFFDRNNITPCVLNLNKSVQEYKKQVEEKIDKDFNKIHENFSENFIRKVKNLSTGYCDLINRALQFKNVHNNNFAVDPYDIIKLRISSLSYFDTSEDLLLDLLSDVTNFVSKMREFNRDTEAKIGKELLSTSQAILGVDSPATKALEIKFDFLTEQREDILLNLGFECVQDVEEAKRSVQSIIDRLDIEISKVLDDYLEKKQAFKSVQLRKNGTIEKSILKGVLSKKTNEIVELTNFYRGDPEKYRFSKREKPGSYI